MSRQFIWLSLALLMLSACTRDRLSVQTDYLSHENLASYQVGTPDPRLYCPPVGQRLIINWSLPASCLDDEVQLKICVRFGNHEQKNECFKLLEASGTYIYSLLNEEYCSKGGIATYKIELWSGDCLLEEWRHQTWVELISF